MNPQTRFALRLVAVGVVSLLSALQAHLPGIDWNDALDCVATAVIAVAAYAGIGAATPLEPSVGKKTSA